MEDAYTLIIGPNAKAYDMGLEASDDGDSFTDCPYPGGSELAAYWNRGFQDAQEECK